VVSHAGVVEVFDYARTIEERGGKKREEGRQKLFPMRHAIKAPCPIPHSPIWIKVHVAAILALSG